MTYTFRIGQRVEVQIGHRWREAIVLAFRPQGDAPGYQVRWNPPVERDPFTGLTPSIGGWSDEKHMRATGAL
jgi:hypothetical protein